MAAAFKNIRGILVTGGVTMYTCPTTVPPTTARVKMLQVSNVDGVNSADATVHWTDASNSNAVTRLGLTVVVPAQTAVNMLTGELALEAGDTLVGIASADSDLELSGSVLEMS